MYMVWHDFHLDDLKVVFGRDGLYELLQSHIHTIYEHFSTILRTEYNVIFTGIYDVTVLMIYSVHICIILYFSS